jgi:hypothetical protein
MTPGPPSSPATSSAASPATTPTATTAPSAPPSRARSAARCAPPPWPWTGTGPRSSPRRPESLAPPEQPQACCEQQTITVPAGVAAKTRQKHDYPSAAWRRSYARRTGAERGFATAKDPASNDITRGWCRLMGLAPLMLFTVTLLAVRNQRILTAWNARQEDNARPPGACHRKPESATARPSPRSRLLPTRPSPATAPQEHQDQPDSRRQHARNPPPGPQDSSPSTKSRWRDGNHRHATTKREHSPH